MHHAVLNTPDGVEVDHRDRNGLNNQKSNLREATHQRNTFNRGKYKNNKSGYKGVSWNRACQKYQVTIGFNWKSVHLGLFDDPVEAAKAYDAKARELFGEFAATNF